MASAINKGQLFSSALLAYMSELKGGKLKKFCEVQTAQGGESVTFNRMKKSTAVDGVASMYTADGGNAGDMVAIKVPIAYISAQDKIKEEDMNKTTIDIKNAYVKSLGNAVQNKEDGKVIEKLAALTAKATPAETECKGAQITNYATESEVKKVIAQIRRTLALAKETPDNHRGVALVISSEDWADLSTSDYVLNNDYNAVFGGGVNGEPTTFYGAEVCIIDNDANVGGTNKVVYLVPSNAICFAEWEGSMRADAEFHATDGLRWHVQAVKSVGAGVAEPNAIVKFTTESVA